MSGCCLAVLQATILGDFAARPGTVVDAIKSERRRITLAKVAAISKTMFTAYVAFRLNFRHLDRFELDLRGHIHVRGAVFSCLRLKLADIVLI